MKFGVFITFFFQSYVWIPKLSYGKTPHGISVVIFTFPLISDAIYD